MPRPSIFASGAAADTKVEPSFSESYEIQCVCNSDSRKCRLELKIQNQQEPHVLEIDEELAYHLTEILEQSAASLSESYDFLTLMEDSRFRCSDLPIPLHAGARKYYTEIGALD